MEYWSIDLLALALDLDTVYCALIANNGNNGYVHASKWVWHHKVGMVLQKFLPRNVHQIY